MRRAGDFIIRDFVVAAPGSAAAVFRENLINGDAVVVFKEDAYLGVFTQRDLLRNPEARIIDALSPKPMVDSSSEILPVILSMCENDFEFLPVAKSGVFEGVVSKKRLCREYFAKPLEPDCEASIIPKLKDELASKDRFMSILSHDMRNMFNQVLGSIEMLENKVISLQDRSAQAIIQLTKQSAEQVHLTFEGMLLWSRFASGATSFNPGLLVLNEIIAHAVKQFHMAANVKGIGIKSWLKHEINIYGDANMLGCILRNLIYNAIKFTHAGGEVWLDAVDQGDDIRITVGDNGIGMTVQQKNEIFREGMSAPGTLNEMGAGIGLVICKEFVEAHNGRIEVESEPGVGSSIVVVIPKNIVMGG